MANTALPEDPTPTTPPPPPPPPPPLPPKQDCCRGKGTGPGEKFPSYTPGEICGGVKSIHGPYRTNKDNEMLGDYPVGEPIILSGDTAHPEKGLLAWFGITIEFEQPCGCCEYRQCIRGYAASKKPGDIWREGSTPSIPSKDFNEDQNENGGYGHHDSPQPTLEKYFEPCVYAMFDFPGFQEYKPGWEYMLWFDFEAVILDACQQIVLQTFSWSIKSSEDAMAYPGPCHPPDPPNGPGGPVEFSSTGGTASEAPFVPGEPSLKAALQAGTEEFNAVVTAYGDAIRLRIDYVRPASLPPTPTAELQVMLRLKNGQTLQLELPGPDSETMVGLVFHGQVYESAEYDLPGLTPAELDAAQITFRGEPSALCTLFPLRPVERRSE